MAKNLERVICIRITETTYQKLLELQKDKFADMKFATLVRTCLILAIAKLGTTKVNNDQSKT